MMRQDGGVPTIILRSLAGRIGTVLVALACLYPVMVIWLADGYGNGLKALVVAAVVVLAVWLLWWRPQAVVAEDEIEVRNAFRSHRIPWESLRGTRTRWGLVLELGSDAPASNVTVSACQRGGVLTAVRHERRAVRVDEAYVTATVTDPSEDAVSAECPTYRTHMDAADAAHLIELYRAARTEYLALTRRLRRRAQRLGKLPAEPTAPVDSGGQNNPSSAALARVPTGRWDRAPMAATAAIVFLLAVVLLAL